MSHVPSYKISKKGVAELHKSACSLAALGYRVFPVHWPVDGECSCRLGPGCGNAAKHPLTPHGLKDATTRQGQIDAWWSKWPNANIGLRTGDGLVVVDIDGAKGESQAARLDLPSTVEASTGRGRHLYYQGNAKGRVNLRPGIDVRGTNGYVIAPPSRHASGAVYEWINSPADRDLAPLPAWVTDAQAKSTDRSVASRPIERRTILEGERNHELFRFACLLRSIGTHEDEIAAAVGARNLACCKPPLDQADIATIAKSAARHPGFHLSDSALLATGITPHTLAIYLAIRARADHKGICIAGYEALADDANVGVARAKSRAVRELEDLGLVAVKRPGPLKLNQPPLANVYTLLDPDEPKHNDPKEDQS